MAPRLITEADLISIEVQRADLPELHIDQRWRARCESCGRIGDERHFRERAAMDGRQHACERGRP